MYIYSQDRFTLLKIISCMRTALKPTTIAVSCSQLKLFTFGGRKNFSPHQEYIIASNILGLANVHN